MGVPELQFVAVTSVRPPKITEPRQVRRVMASQATMDSESFRGCYQVVMYYENMKEDYVGDYVWVMAGWCVESLTEALLEYPLLAGRLQRKEEEGGGGMEIVSNDSGIRMVEAKISISLSDLLEGGEKGNLEHELVFWRDIDEKYPEFSPVSYVQVTSFECGGYSIGISCSLLVADFLVVDNFLKKWADIHKNQLPRSGEIETPIFYHPRLQNLTDSPPTDITIRTQYKNGGQSLLFKITAEEDSELESELARLCVLNAEKKLHRKIASEFCLFVKESCKIIIVGTCSENEQSGQVLGLKNQMRSTTWDEFGDYNVEFEEGNMPVRVSRWIGSASDMNFLAVTNPKDGVPVAILVITLAAENRTSLIHGP